MPILTDNPAHPRHRDHFCARMQFNTEFLPEFICNTGFNPVPCIFLKRRKLRFYPDDKFYGTALICNNAPLCDGRITSGSKHHYLSLNGGPVIGLEFGDILFIFCFTLYGDLLFTHDLICYLAFGILWWNKKLVYQETEFCLNVICIRLSPPFFNSFGDSFCCLSNLIHFTSPWFF